MTQSPKPPLMLPHAHTLAHPITLRDTSGLALRTVGVVTINRRPVYRDIKAVQQAPEALRVDEMLARLTDLDRGLIDELDLEDVTALSEMMLSLFLAPATKKR